MSTTLHSFIDIFDTEISDGETSVKLNKIAIPLIQRDYAQGRMDNDVQRVRSRFLDSLYNAITNEPITLDFIYGDIDENGTMTPLVCECFYIFNGSAGLLNKVRDQPILFGNKGIKQMDLFDLLVPVFQGDRLHITKRFSTFLCKLIHIHMRHLAALKMEWGTPPKKDPPIIYWISSRLPSSTFCVALGSVSVRMPSL